ncbi:MAG: tRNA uridine-5-carboxymethylaminomethyl(34) synthesis GTPase MnmE, partial [Zetaproteobacteria bacterium]|nr:tRNA uridine-5-carboxymethylaminomethyl(34) synthesis GTPase MnmE [Pseudobdellovibrionaceae bacterium]
GPGEYTKRAFLSGKLDLTAAEGIRELVSAQSKQEWQAARSLATGGLAKEINGLRNALVEAMAYLEARIDFPDEGDTQDTHLDDVYARVKKVDDRVGALLQTWDNGRVAAEGLKVALIGLPNAGKSTLLNALLKSDRAIVTAIAGTTRDYIEEKCMLNGRLFRLVDTAGIRDSDDQVEKIGIEQSIQISRDADIVVAMVGADTPPAEAEKIDVLVDGCDADVIKITTKSDLGLGIGWEGSVPISCYNSDGLDILKDLLVEAVDSHLNKLEDKVYITTERHRSALEETQISLKRFFDSYESGGFDECLAFELQEASRSLVSIIGVVGVEDILDKVFSQFCVGK